MYAFGAMSKRLAKSIGEAIVLEFEHHQRRVKSQFECNEPSESASSERRLTDE
jgi:hypothetical protein